MSLWMKAGKTQLIHRAYPVGRRRPLIRRLAGLTAVLVGMPVLALSLTTG